MHIIYAYYIYIYIYNDFYNLPLTKSLIFVCLSVAKNITFVVRLCSFKISVTTLGFNSHRGYGGAR
jgi:hypothetical protein